MLNHVNCRVGHLPEDLMDRGSGGGGGYDANVMKRRRLQGVVDAAQQTVEETPNGLFGRPSSAKMAMRDAANMIQKGLNRNDSIEELRDLFIGLQKCTIGYSGDAADCLTVFCTHGLEALQ